MSQADWGGRSSVNAAYQASKQEILVSIASAYNKLNGIEPETSAELLRYAVGWITLIIEELGVTAPGSLPCPG